MKGLVLYVDNSKKAFDIKKQLEAKMGYSFDVKRIYSIVSIPEGIVYIASEWDARIELYKLMRDTDVQFGIAFYNEIFFSDIDHTETIDYILKDAIIGEKWEICKSINLFYLMGDIIRKRNVLRSKPIKLQIETTDLCNAKCIMCSHAYSEGTGLDILETGIVDRIESILPFVKIIVLHGNGEPFLKKNITKYLKKMSQYGVKFITNSNLSVVTEELLPFLQNDFIELNVSCDGHTPELYEHIRKGLSFRKFVENVRHVRMKCPDLTMKMSVVLMKQNIEYMARIVDFANDLGFNEVVFNQLCVDEKNDNLQDAAYFYPEKLQKYTKLAITEGEKKDITVTVPYIFSSEKETIDVDTDSTFIQCIGVCDWIVECPYIDLRGNVSACCIKQNEILGNLFHEKFESIWNGERYIRARDEFKTGRLPFSCSGCDFINQKRLQYISTQDIGIRMLKKEMRN